MAPIGKRKVIGVLLVLGIAAAGAAEALSPLIPGGRKWISLVWLLSGAGGRKWISLNWRSSRANSGRVPRCGGHIPQVATNRIAADPKFSGDAPDRPAPPV